MTRLVTTNVATDDQRRYRGDRDCHRIFDCSELAANATGLGQPRPAVDVKIRRHDAP